MKYIKTLLALLLASYISSCKKADDKVKDPIIEEPICAISSSSNCYATSYETDHSIHKKIVYDDSGRVKESDDYVFRYAPGKMKAYRKLTNHYVEAKLNSDGRIITMYTAKYNVSDSSIVGTLKLNENMTFDEKGNLLKFVQYSVSPLNYKLADGTSLNLYHDYNRFEYDNNGNVVKCFGGYSNDVTGTPAGEYLLMEYLQYDNKLSPIAKNETLRFVDLIGGGNDDCYSKNNPLKAKFYFKDHNPFGDYKFDPWEANYTNTYNSNCYLTNYKYTVQSVGIDPYEMNCTNTYDCK